MKVSKLSWLIILLKLNYAFFFTPYDAEHNFPSSQQQDQFELLYAKLLQLI